MGMGPASMPWKAMAAPQPWSWGNMASLSMQCHRTGSDRLDHAGVREKSYTFHPSEPHRPA